VYVVLWGLCDANRILESGSGLQSFIHLLVCYTTIGHAADCPRRYEIQLNMAGHCSIHEFHARSQIIHIVLSKSTISELDPINVRRKQNQQIYAIIQYTLVSCFDS